MRCKTVCAKCGSTEIEYLFNDRCFCFACNAEHDSKDIFIDTHYEQRRNAAYATGNRWAIENWNATH